MEHFFNKTKIIWIYLVIEIAFQVYLKSTVVSMKADHIQALELISRCLFTVSVSLFLWYGIGVRNLFAMAVSAGLCFIISAQVYPTIRKHLSEEVQQAMLNNFAWGAQHKVLGDASQLLTTLTLSFPEYNEKGKEVSSQFEKSKDPTLFYQIDDALYKGMRKAELKMFRRHYNTPNNPMFDRGVWEKHINSKDPQKAINIVLDIVNERFVSSIEKKLNTTVSNRRPLGTVIPVTQGSYEFDKGMQEWITSEMLAKGGIDDGIEFALKMMIMVPLGFFFSAIGILVNASSLIVQTGLHFNQKSTALGVITAGWLGIVVYGINSIPEALSTMTGVYWLTPIFSVVKLVSFV